MIEGITVLSQEIIYEYIYDYSLIGWGFAIAAATVFLLCLFATRDGWVSLGMGLLCSLLGILVGMIVMEHTAEIIPTDRNQYKVLIEDGVQMTDFYEHFEVIEQDGEIWVIEDKDNSK